jgi:hypothetical protein
MLIRTRLDVLASCYAVVSKYGDAEFMAFKFMAAGGQDCTIAAVGTRRWEARLLFRHHQHAEAADHHFIQGLSNMDQRVAFWQAAD